MELSLLSKDKFAINHIESYLLKFTQNKNGEINELIFVTADSKIIAAKNEMNTKLLSELCVLVG